MISTKWFQGTENLNDVMMLRKKVFCNELKVEEKSISDIYDEFAFSVVQYDDLIPIGTGRLIFKDGIYLIDNICVIKEYRGNRYSDLIIRMLVRKAVNIGAEKTYAEINKKYLNLFDKIGFEQIDEYGDGTVLVMKTGDVGGHCAHKKLK